MIPARVFGDKRRNDDHARPRSATTTPARSARIPFGVHDDRRSGAARCGAPRRVAPRRRRDPGRARRQGRCGRPPRSGDRRRQDRSLPVRRAGRPSPPLALRPVPLRLGARARRRRDPESRAARGASGIVRGSGRLALLASTPMAPSRQLDVPRRGAVASGLPAAIPTARRTSTRRRGVRTTSRGSCGPTRGSSDSPRSSTGRWSSRARAGIHSCRCGTPTRCSAASSNDSRRRDTTNARGPVCASARTP